MTRVDRKLIDYIVDMVRSELRASLALEHFSQRRPILVLGNF